MENRHFDDLARALGRGATRRAGIRALLGGLIGAGALAAADERGAAKRRCRRDSPAGQCCKKDGTCTCKNGGIACGTNCCLIGQSCENGACVSNGSCIAYGQACKGTGRPCCTGLTCGSGQGGQNDVACYVPAGGPCTSSGECTYGASCVDGACIANPTCNVQLGQPCGPADICCQGICKTFVPDSARARGPVCCIEIGEACTDSSECCPVVNVGARRILVSCDPNSRVCVSDV